MRSRVVVWGVILMMLGTGALIGCAPAADQSGTHVSIPAETVADYVHAVIEADRTFYTMQVVERLQKQGKMVASEDWRVKHTLPLPAQFLKESSELAAMTGTKVRYHLIGLWPINPSNGAATDFERKGLEAVRQHPEQAYTGYLAEGDKRYFGAVYADRAVTQACIGCHNAHPASPKKDFKRDDVMGAIVITIPLDR